MKPSEALRRNRDELLRILTEHGVEDARVFGSVMRGEDREGSDLDLLVRFAPGTSLLDVGALGIALEELLACRVDLVSERGLRGERAGRIMREARAL